MQKMIGYRPDAGTLKQIKEAAKAENRKLAVMVGEIVKRYFASIQAAKQAPDA